MGLISFSVDGEPILGALGDLSGLYLGCGFHSGGFAYNPVAGELLAEIVSEGAPRIELSTFSPDRFEVRVRYTPATEEIPLADAMTRVKRWQYKVGDMLDDEIPESEILPFHVLGQ